MSDLSKRIAGLTPKQRALLELRRSQSADTGPSVAEPIAVIGIGCRFAGGVTGPQSFWKLLREGVDAITEVPPDRWDIDAYYDPNPDTPGKMYTRWGGFLSDVDRFDAKFFGINPREAATMDPQQRLLLEVAWEALEHAGQRPDLLVGTKTGVFVGMMTNDYSQLNLAGHDPAQMDVYSGSGVDYSFAAGRLSYVLGVQGPSMVIATACSSSLVAAHLACQSLRAGECQVALAGGVSLILTPEATLYSCRIRSMAADGRCKTFDAAADGYVRGEGCGIVVLKRLPNAVRDGDRILALIRGSAVNHDGKSAGLTVPNAAAQQAVIRSALAGGGVRPNQVGYVEAHGTGTPLGDPIEIRSLWSVLGQGRTADRPLVVGSAKTNMGHLEAAAGVAGLIKAVLALQHREIPPHLHLQKPSPYIEWDSMRIDIPQALRPWPADNVPAIAGVSSFGLSGMNAHVVLEEPPKMGSDPSHATVTHSSRSRPAAREGSDPIFVHNGNVYLLPLSARTPAALRASAERYREYLERPAERVHDICYSASLRRSHLDERVAVVGATVDELRAGVEKILQRAAGKKQTERPKVAFVFPGQGGQYAGMARQLLAGEPVFRQTVEAFEKEFRKHGDGPLTELLEHGENWEAGIQLVQPAIFAVQVGLAALWQSWGIRPDGVIGHSMGEVAAAHVAGILSLTDAARIVCRRSALMTRIRGRGGMLLVELGLEEARMAISEISDKVEVAASNGPRTTVIAGDVAALDGLAQELERNGVFCRRVQVDVASHSRQVESLQESLEQALEGVGAMASAIPMYSTVNGTVIEGEVCDRDYWMRNLRQRVQFWEAFQAMAGDGHRVFVELSPHPVLGPSIEEGLRALRIDGDVRASTRRNEDERRVMLETLAALYEHGQTVAWQALYPEGGQLVDLPTYPWQREHFWIAPPDPERQRIRTGGHPLLGEHHEYSGEPGTHVWDFELSTEKWSYLADHCIEGLVVVPAAVYVELALAASRQAFGESMPELEHLRFQQMLVLPQSEPVAVQLVLRRSAATTASFQIASRSAATESWTVHASGRTKIGGTAETTSETIEAIQARCSQLINVSEYYRAFAARGLDYGPAFQAVKELRRQDGEALGRVQLPAAMSGNGSHTLHPILLDAGFQCLGAALPQTGDGDPAPVVPVGLERVQFLKPAVGDFWAHARITSNSGAVEGDVLLFNAGGEVVARVSGFRMQPLERGTRRREAFSDWLFQLQWQAVARAETEKAGRVTTDFWLVFADRQGIGQALAESFTTNGEHCVVVSAGTAYALSGVDRYQLDPLDAAGFRQLLKRMSGPCRGVVHLWGLDLPAKKWGLTPLAEQDVNENQRFLLRGRGQTPFFDASTVGAVYDRASSPDSGKDARSQTAPAVAACMSVVHLVQALTTAGWRDLPRLWLVTSGSQKVQPEEVLSSPEQATLWGLGRTIAMEHPELACTRVDLGSIELPGAVESLRAEILNADREDQVALRGDMRFAARLTRWQPESDGAEPVRALAADQPFRLEIDAPGILDKLTLKASERIAPGPTQVHIEVKASGLNFLDVLSAMGIRPDTVDGPIALGGECSGTVTAVGSEVRNIKVGDAVMALAPFSFGTYVTTEALLVVRKPDNISFEEAAAIPVVFLTAYYALIHLGRLASGESILIHSASGGTGLAAVQLAQRVGAEIFATAGSEEKRAFLRSLGIRHVMDSRSMAFADEVLQATGQRGVDLVLNSLTGDAISRSLAALAPYGRFLEIGKKDIYQNSQIGLQPFQKNLSYFAVDLSRMIVERPAFIHQTFSGLAQQFADGSLQPPRVQVLPIADAASGFHTMAQARHVGKIVFSFEEKGNTPIVSDSAKPFTIDPARTAVIAGGLGGLGLLLTEWLVERGSRHLLLIGRRPPSPAAEKRLVALRAAGATITVAQADIANRDELAVALAQPELPPLGGVIHAAAVLEDSTIQRLDAARLEAVMRPKIDGARHLHELTREAKLDFFVLFSSAASMMGSPGQANYSAANSYLDALAHVRRNEGQPALSINWGPWSEVGLAAAQANRGERLATQGMASISPSDGLRTLEYLLSRAHNPVQVAVMPLNLRHWRQMFPRAMRAPFLTRLLEEGDDSRHAETAVHPVRAELEAAMPALRQSRLEAHLIEQLAQVLRMPSADLERDMPLPALGLDSLMALELRNRLELSLGITLSATLIWGYPTISALAPFLIEKMGLAESTGTRAGASPLEEEPARMAAVAALSDDAAAAILAEKLAGLDAEYQ